MAIMMQMKVSSMIVLVVTTLVSFANAQINLPIPGGVQDAVNNLVDGVQNGDVPAVINEVTQGVETATGVVDTTTQGGEDLAEGDAGGLLDIFEGIGDVLDAIGGGDGTALGDVLDEASNVLETYLGNDTLTFESVEELVNFYLPENITLPPGFEFTEDIPFDAATFTLPPGSTDTLPADFEFPANMQELATMVVMGTGGLGGGVFCTLCDGEGFDPDLEFAGISCDDWTFISSLAFAAGSEQCYIMRAVAAKFCGCQADTVETCGVCEDGAEELKMDQPLWILPNVTCADLMSLPAVDGDDTCSNIQSVGYLCGCEGAQPECSICGDDGVSMGNPLELLNMMAGGGVGQMVVPDFSCSDLQGLFSLPGTLSFVNFFSEALLGEEIALTCEDLLAQAETSLGFQLQGYCGCINAPPAPNMCDLCPNSDYEVPQRSDNPIPRCGHMSFKAQFVTNMTICEELQNDAEAFKCCDAPEKPSKETPEAVSDPAAQSDNSEPTEQTASDPTEQAVSESMQGSEPADASYPTEASVEASSGTSSGAESTGNDETSEKDVGGQSSTTETTSQAAAAASSGRSSLISSIQDAWWTGAAAIFCVLML